MIMGRSIIPDKSLRDYTDEELADFLDKNQSTDLKVLAGICSEILRRQHLNREKCEK